MFGILERYGNLERALMVKHRLGCTLRWSFGVLDLTDRFSANCRRNSRINTQTSGALYKTPAGPFLGLTTATPISTKEQYMTFVEPQYGIAEARTHWWATYHTHHKDKLQIEDVNLPTRLHNVNGQRLFRTHIYANQRYYKLDVKSSVRFGRRKVKKHLSGQNDMVRRSFMGLVRLARRHLSKFFLRCGCRAFESRTAWASIFDCSSNSSTNDKSDTGCSSPLNDWDGDSDSDSEVLVNFHEILADWTLVNGLDSGWAIQDHTKYEQCERVQRI